MEPDAEDMPSAAGTSSSSSGSGSNNNSNNTSSSGISTSGTTPGRGSPGIKCCSGCQTTKTPLWRGGPDGPKSLCNACGIRYRKRRREVLGITDDHPDIPASASAADLTATNKKRKHPTSNRPKPAAAAAKVNMLRVFPKQADRLLDQRLLLWLNSRQRHSRLREEEQAAVLLMALSCGILYA